MVKKVKLSTQEQRQQKKEMKDRLRNTCEYLNRYREHGWCAMGGECLFKKLYGWKQRVHHWHHITKRSAHNWRYRDDSPFNLLGLCSTCHDREGNLFQKHPPKGEEYCRNLAKSLNKRYNIPEVIDGSTNE